MAESSPSHDLMYDTAANHYQTLLILVLSIAITAAINSFFLNFSTSIIISKTKIMDLSRPERGRRRKTLSNNSRSINKYTFFHHCCYITFFFFLLTSYYLYIYTFIHLLIYLVTYLPSFLPSFLQCHHLKNSLIFYFQNNPLDMSVQLIFGVQYLILEFL